MFFWNSFAFSVIQWMLAIWSLVSLPFLNPACTSGSSWFTYCWSLLSHKQQWNMPFAATWIELQIILLSEVSQKEKGKYHMISLICKHKIGHKWNYETETGRSESRTTGIWRGDVFFLTKFLKRKVLESIQNDCEDSSSYTLRSSSFIINILQSWYTCHR